MGLDDRGRPRNRGRPRLLKMARATGKPERFVKAVFDTPAAMADEAAGFLVARGAIGCAIAQSFKPGVKPPKVVPLEAFFTGMTESQLAGQAHRTDPRDALGGDAGWRRAPSARQHDR